MEAQSLIEKAGGYEALARRLQDCSAVTAHDHDDHKEAWVLAHALTDLETEFRQFLNVGLPALLAASAPEEICDALVDIQMELRHVFYHLLDPDTLENEDLIESRRRR